MAIQPSAASNHRNPKLGKSKEAATAQACWPGSGRVRMAQPDLGRKLLEVSIRPAQPHHSRRIPEDDRYAALGHVGARREVPDPGSANARHDCAEQLWVALTAPR